MSVGLSPLQLFIFICALAVLRVGLSLRPIAASARGKSARWIVREYLDAFIVAGAAALFIITFIARTHYIPSESMEPTLHVHDVILTNEIEYRLRAPQHDDVAIFEPPIESASDFIKRVIGTPGDTLSIRHGTVFRNGADLSEPYIAAKPAYDLEIKNYGIVVDGIPLDPASANIPPRAQWQAPDRIPDGYYFMMGDNRNNSDDSHIWGFAQSHGTFASGPKKGRRAGFTGHAAILFWPLDRLRVVK